MMRAFITALLVVFLTDVAVRCAWGAETKNLWNEEPPSRVLVGNNEYRVVLSPHLVSNIMGVCHFGAPKVILLSTNQNPQELWQTFFHEALHAISDEFETPLDHKQIGKLEIALEQFLFQLHAQWTKK